MTGNWFGSGWIAKYQMSNEWANGYSNHDPAIVCHEKKPVMWLIKFLGSLLEQPIFKGKKKDGVTEKYSHDEKTIKHLYGVERSQDDLPLSLQGPFAISSYNELWASFITTADIIDGSVCSSRRCCWPGCCSWLVGDLVVLEPRQQRVVQRQNSNADKKGERNQENLCICTKLSWRGRDWLGDKEEPNKGPKEEGGREREKKSKFDHIPTATGPIYAFSRCACDTS